MKLVSVTSGKGGVGKTTMTCNLAVSLAASGHRVLILDGDLGMANVDIFFGVRAKRTIKDLLDGVEIDECITKLVQNVDLLAGGSGLQELIQMNSFERREIVQQVQSLHLKYDYVLIDTAPGLHDYVLHLNSVAEERVVLITQDPSSIADAYALIKVMNAKYKTNQFSVVCNLIAEDSGEQLFERFSQVVEKFLNVRLRYLGAVPDDVVLRKSQRMQRLVMRQNVHSVSQGIISEIGNKIVEQSYNKNKDESEGLGAIFSQASGHA